MKIRDFSLEFSERSRYNKVCDCRPGVRSGPSLKLERNRRRDIMSVGALETLAAAEDRLKREKAETAAALKQAEAEAKARGEELLAQARQRAKDEIADLTRETVEQAKVAARTLAEQSERERDSLRARARQKEEDAIAYVLERVME